MSTLAPEDFEQELHVLLLSALSRYRAEAPPPIIYTASIWVDPDARLTVLALDTQESSAASVAASNEWAKKHYDRLALAGNLQEAELFRPQTGRNRNPWDFAYRRYASVENRSFPPGWAEATGNACWELLEPQLRAFVPAALAYLSDCSCHRAAELGINGPEDWYQFTWPLRSKSSRSAEDETPNPSLQRTPPG